MKTAFIKFISKLNKAKERISELEDRSIEITQGEMQKEKRGGKNKENTPFKIGWAVINGVKHVSLESLQKTENGAEEIL